MADPVFERYKEALKQGHMAMLKGRHKDALTHYQEAASLADHRALPFVSMGSVLLQMGRAQDAIAAYDEALLVEERERRRNGDRRTVVASHRVDSDRDGHAERSSMGFKWQRGVKWIARRVRRRGATSLPARGAEAKQRCIGGTAAGAGFRRRHSACVQRATERPRSGHELRASCLFYRESARPPRSFPC